MDREFLMFKFVLEKTEEAEIKLPTSVGSSKEQQSSRETSISVYDYAKAFDCGPQQTLENSSRDGSTRPPDLPP